MRFNMRYALSVWYFVNGIGLIFVLQSSYWRFFIKF